MPSAAVTTAATAAATAAPAAATCRRRTSPAALGAALNANATDQSVDQSQGGGYDAAKCGTAVPTASRPSVSSRGTSSPPTRRRTRSSCGPRTTNIPVRIGSAGDDGSVDQTNAALALALAANLNYTRQEVTQTQ